MDEELARLEAEAAELDAAAAPRPTEDQAQEGQGASAAPPIDPVDEITGILEAMRVLAVARGFTRSAEVLNDKSIGAIARALAPLLTKYNISVGDFFGKWKEEIMAAIVVGPIVFDLVRALRNDMEAKAASEAKPVPPADPAPTDAAGK